jgi:hypothetical protein
VQRDSAWNTTQYCSVLSVILSRVILNHDLLTHAG